MPDDAPITREDLAALERRLASLERSLAARDAPVSVVRCVECRQLVPQGSFCTSCGAPLSTPSSRLPASTPTPPPPPPSPRPAPAPRAPPPPVTYTAAPVAPRPTPTPPTAPPTAAAPAPAPVPRPVARPAPARPAKPPMTLESMLGQRWAPRAGAVLVFLGVVFFLGVAIQRGWIGPLLQLALAALTGVGLLAGGAILTARKGYGRYPQILEATGACVLYVTAFVAYALPYYRNETQLTELGSGLLMAAVAIGTVALALWRDSRVIAGLGYTLAFVTALFGQDALPSITLPYVALLGTSLAILVERKRWIGEGAAGTLATGGFFVALALRGEATGDPTPWLVAVCALVPAAAFLWLAARPATTVQAPRALGDAGRYLPAVIAFVTLAWLVTSTRPMFEDRNAQGALVLVWALIAAGYAALAHRRAAGVPVVAAAGIVGIALWWIGAPLAWSGEPEAALLVTFTYAIGAVALALVPARGAAWGASFLTALAAMYSVFAEMRLTLPDGDGIVLGPWQAWASALVVTVAAAATIAGRSARDTTGRRMALLVFALYAGAQSFALGRSPLAVTIALVAVAAVIHALALLRIPRRYLDIAPDASVASVALLALAAAQSGMFAGGARDVDLWIGALILVPAILATFALRPRPAVQEDVARVVDGFAILSLLAWPLAYWRDATNGGLLATGTYAVSALALGVLARALPARKPLDLWTASFIFASASAVYAMLFQGGLQPPWEPTRVIVGGIDAWITLLLVSGALALFLATPRSATASPARIAGIALAAVFLTVWTFALFPSTLLATLWLVLLGGAFVGFASAARGDNEIARAFWLAAMGVITVVAVKVALIDMLVPAVRLDMPLAAGQSVLVAAALLVLHQMAKRRGVFPQGAQQPAAIMLVGGSAAVLADFLLAYGEGAWTSLGLGALGVAYLGTGLAIRSEALYRYTGFALLAVVLLRVFLVDLSNTDLAVRALVFAVLGAILLGVGYAYARISKREATPPP